MLHEVGNQFNMRRGVACIKNRFNLLRTDLETGGKNAAVEIGKALPATLQLPEI